MLDKRIIHLPGRIDWDSERVHHATQNSMKLKTEESFIFGIFHLIFLEHNWLQVTETMESETGLGRTTVLSKLKCRQDNQWTVELGMGRSQGKLSGVKWRCDSLHQPVSKVFAFQEKMPTLM